MSLKKIARQTGVVFSHELKQSFTNWKVVVVLIIYFAAMVGSLKVVSDLEDTINKKIYENSDESDVVVFGDTGMVDDAEVEIPKEVNLLDEIKKDFGSLTVIPFSSGVIILPLIVLLLGFNLISSERAHNSIRYLVSRVSRVSIIIGKFLANGLILVTSTIIFLIISSFYLRYKIGEIVVFKSVIYPAVFLTVYSLALLSFMMLTSSFSKKVWGSMVFAVVGLVLLLMLPAYSYVKVISFFSYMSLVFKGDFGERLINIFRLSGLTIGYFLFAWFRFERVDL